MQGVGAELGFALLAYRVWNLASTMLSGALAGLGCGIYYWIMTAPNSVSGAVQMKSHIQKTSPEAAAMAVAVTRSTTRRRPFFIIIALSAAIPSPDCP